MADTVTGAVKRRVPAACAMVAATLLWAAAPTTPVRAAEAWPSEVKAHYDVKIAGVQIGSFVLHVETANGRYAARGQAHAKLLFGALKWSGSAESQGLAAAAPKPHSFSFEQVSKRKLLFKSKEKAKRVDMTFDRSGVTGVTLEPHKPPGANNVPVTLAHMRNVLDPLSAVLALTRDDGNPCDRKVSVFDGKQRFDIVLSPRGRQSIGGGKAAGAVAAGHVCGVRYVPIAGHNRDDAENQNLSDTSKIEVVMRPVPDAGIVVPHEVRVPTLAGDAVLTATRIEITTASRQRIALGR